MATKIYGTSDDLIEAEGDVSGEYYAIDTDLGNDSRLLICSDGTLMTVGYGKGDLAVWAITVLHEGELIESVEVCTDEDAEIYSDIAHFKDGLKWIYAARGWELMK